MDATTTQMILKLLISLAVVIGMIWLLVKLVSLRSKWINRNRPLKILGGVGVGPQKSVQLVEIGDVLYVLGIGQDVTLLRIIDDSEEKERIRGDFMGTKENTISWIDRFHGHNEQPRSSEFSSVLKQKLVDMQKQRHHSLSPWLDKPNHPAEKEIKH